MMTSDQYCFERAFKSPNYLRTGRFINHPLDGKIYKLGDPLDAWQNIQTILYTQQHSCIQNVFVLMSFKQ